MNTQDVLEEFVKEHMQNTSDFMLYRDKQLLKEENYREFAREQLKKNKKIFWSSAFAIFFCSWYGVLHLIKYGGSYESFDLIIGLGSWVGLVIGVLFSAKQYYTIKSSMNLLIKLIDNEADLAQNNMPVPNH